MRSFEVEISGYMPEVFHAETRDKARYRAYLQFCEAFGRQTFGDFLRRGVAVREVRS